MCKCNQALFHTLFEADYDDQEDQVIELGPFTWSDRLRLQPQLCAVALLGFALVLAFVTVVTL